MKKLILSLVAGLTAMGLYAGETTVNSAEENMTDNARVTRFIVKGREDGSSEPTQRAKNLNQAVERWANGKASDADKELIKSEDGPFIKKLQDATVYGFQMDIDNPIYHLLAGGSAGLSTLFAAIVDLYMIQHCTNDLSRMTQKDIQDMGSTKEYGVMIALKFGSEFNEHQANARDSYVKFVHAARAFNCGDKDALKKFLQEDNQFEATFLAGLAKEDLGDMPVQMIYKNAANEECIVFGHTSPTFPEFGSQFARTEIKLEKETCKSGETFMIKGYATMPDGNVFFRNITPGDKVKIIKTK